MKRRGISLNEVLVVCSLMAILMPLCGKLLWTLANSNRTLSRDMDERRALMRLISQLKTDSLQSERLLADHTPRFEAESGESITYENSERGVLRLVTKKDEVLHREEFVLHPGVLVQAVKQSPGNATRVVISGLNLAEARLNEIHLTLPVERKGTEVKR